MKTNAQPSKQRSNKGGFALVEVMVGIGVVGIVFVALYSGMTSATVTMRMAREDERATQIMVEKLDTIRLYSWEKVTDPGYIPTNFTAVFAPSAFQHTYDVSGEVTNNTRATGVTYSGTVAVTAAPVAEAYRDNMRHITITLAWNTGGVLRQRSMSTLVAKDGMQNYIY